jgi:acetyl-CoA carboxylase biotin carboxyl carrier protein
VTDERAGHTPAGDADEPVAGLEELTDEVLPALIARLRASRLGELEVRTGAWRVRLRRDPDVGVRASAGGATSAEAAPDEPPDGSVARSTAVGYFTPGRELVVGASVRSGDLLGTIDVLGISQEVTAPEDGIVVAVLAEEGQAVEYGQALAEIEPLELDLGGRDGEDPA